MTNQGASLSVAVVGAGVAGYGVLDGLQSSKRPVNVVVFSSPVAAPHGAPDNLEPLPSETSFPKLVRSIRARHGLMFPPPKTHFGYAPKKFTVEGWGSIWRSELGGLTAIWGASALPLPETQLCKWFGDNHGLRPHLERAAELMRVAGNEDALSPLWGGGLAIGPALSTVPMYRYALDRLGHAGHRGAHYDILGGYGRLAIESRPDAPMTCRYCGNCMAGCRYGSIFNASDALAALKSLPNQVVKTEKAHVHCLHFASRMIEVRDANGKAVLHGPFDKIFVAAGCLGSSILLLRSMPKKRFVQIRDNSVTTFPVLSLRWLGKKYTSGASGYHALTNMVLVAQPRDPDTEPAVVQLYPLFDYLWQYLTPAVAWPALSMVGKRLRNHVGLARLYLPGSESQTYSLSIDDKGGPIFTLTRQPTPIESIPGLWSDVKGALRHCGLLVPPAVRISHSTSSHYAGGFPVGGEDVNANGEIAPNVYLCDSAAFPDSSAYSPTLTIFAYARRVTTAAVYG